MYIKEFISRDLAKFFSDNGIEFASEYVWNDEQIINPEIEEKFGSLSDDGYYELTKECGGELDFNEVYVYEPHIIKRFNVIIEKNKYDAPTLNHVLRWLFKTHHIFIDITLSPRGFIPMINYNIKEINEKYEFDVISQDDYPDEIMLNKTPIELYEKTLKYIVENNFFNK